MYQYLSRQNLSFPIRKFAYNKQQILSIQVQSPKLPKLDSIINLTIASLLNKLLITIIKASRIEQATRYYFTIIMTNFIIEGCYGQVRKIFEIFIQISIDEVVRYLEFCLFFCLFCVAVLLR